MKKYPLSRRGALKMLGAVMLTEVSAQLLLSSRARAAMASAGSDLKVFMDVSTTLSGRPELNIVQAQALYAALQVAVTGFDVTLAKLQALLAQNADFSSEYKEEMALSQTILRAWYLGVVGNGKKAVCVTYVDALSNVAVSDKLVPPSYSYGPCGTWQAKP